MFNSLNNRPEDVVKALEETAKLAAKLKAKKETLKVNDNLFITIEEDCDCFGCTTMRHKCEKDFDWQKEQTNDLKEMDKSVYDDDGIYMHTKETA